MMHTSALFNIPFRYHRRYLLLVLGVFLATALFSLSYQTVGAASLTAPATPSATTHGGPAEPFGGFQHTTPSSGTWTSTTTSLQEGTVGAYLVPQLTNTCESAEVISLVTTIENTDIVLGGLTQSLAGVMMFMVDTSSVAIPAPPIPVTEISSGAVWVNNNNVAARGITHPIFTVSPVTIPGSIVISFDTSGMTASDYNNLAVTVQHDLLDGLSGFVTSVSSSQPVVAVTTNDAPCYSVPTAQDDSDSVTIGNIIEVSAEDGLLKNDTGEGTTVTSYTQPENGTVVVNPDGSYTYTPNESFIGTDTFTYTITDSFGRTATATVTITVHPIPGPPAAGTQTARNLILGIATILPMIALTIRYRNSIMRLLPQIRRHPQ